MTECMKNERNMFPLTWKAYMKQAAAHTVRGLRVKLQSAKSECGGWAGGSKCVFTFNSSDLTQIPSHAKVSTVREVFILNQRLNSYDSMQSVFLFPFLIQGFRSLTSSEGVLRAQSYFRKDYECQTWPFTPNWSLQTVTPPQDWFCWRFFLLTGSFSFPL